mmetsp:Transcript_41834/g.72721  ORF Transcript_41834/g.72721 Transcript_41834/m.72721 type:complete len:222 (+) Transcript_41834:71-736(+)
MYMNMEQLSHMTEATLADESNASESQLQIPEVFVGKEIEIQDTHGIWWEATIQKVDETGVPGGRVCISYLAFHRPGTAGGAGDEWVSLRSGRIAEVGTHTYKTGQVLKMGHRIEARHGGKSSEEVLMQGENGVEGPPRGGWSFAVVSAVSADKRWVELEFEEERRRGFIEKLLFGQVRREWVKAEQKDESRVRPRTRDLARRRASLRQYTLLNRCGMHCAS